MKRNRVIFVASACLATILRAGEANDCGNDAFCREAFATTAVAVPIFANPVTATLKLDVDLPKTVRLNIATPAEMAVSITITNPCNTPVAVFLNDEEVTLFVHLIGVSYPAVYSKHTPNSNEMLIDIGRLLRRDHGATDKFVFAPQSSVTFRVNARPLLHSHSWPSDLLCVHGELHATHAYGREPVDALIFRPGVVRSERIQVNIWDPC
jgi:hypothetical protein